MNDHRGEILCSFVDSSVQYTAEYIQWYGDNISAIEGVWGDNTSIVVEYQTVLLRDTIQYCWGIPFSTVEDVQYTVEGNHKHFGFYLYSTCSFPLKY